MNPLRRRLYHLIRFGYREVTADDVTDNGALALDPAHSPNGKQSGIGSFFQQMGKEGVLRRTGRVVRSEAPKRKGGMIQVWEVTPHGVAEARRHRPRIVRV